MCLAIPMKIIELTNNNMAVVESDGAKISISVALIDNPQPGDFVIIHAGYAIERLDQEAADKQIELFRELASMNFAPN
ncbi:MAG TPA: hypothetical protein DD381_05975 [Lentisphaeria bacterium]|nr:MAG: hydrogenase assembly protein HypC [Lentisphaerae bacterium GWF2_38_69]HBM15873.1 hypothetical protein [Lentisphaeria bacterium]